MGGALGGAGRGRAHAAAAAPNRRDAIPVGGVGDVAPAGLAGPSPQRLAIPRQAATPLLGHPARLARLRRQRVVAQAAPASRGSSLSVPAREPGPTALARRPGRSHRLVDERTALGPLLDPGPLRHPADRLRSARAGRSGGRRERETGPRLDRLRHRGGAWFPRQGTSGIGARASGGVVAPWWTSRLRFGDGAGTSAWSRR